jgi:3-deoxy-manno-octulosonate cytidylyltransferase (CMP-KDO synthetase)
MVIRALGVIPARLASERLPRKALRLIAGRPMLAWVYEGARRAPGLDRVLVATDSEEIAEFCARERIPVAMTSATHRSGTDRIVEVMSREPAAIYVNIQGDEPMVRAEHIELLLEPLRGRPANASEVATLKVRMTPEDARDPNKVKVVTDAGDLALYFSRAPIPYDRDATGQPPYYKHLGFYAYTAAALEKFRTLAPSPLEQAERLEQLRFLENGIPIRVLETPYDTLGVDTEEDLRAVEQQLRRS